MPFKPITPPPRFRLSDAVSAQLEQMIAEGMLRPGDALPSERDLAQQMGVSRPSLREALLRLDSRGLIAVRSGGGYVVANASGPLIADSLAHLMGQHPKTAHDIFEMREALESLTVQWATRRATTDDLQRMEAALETLEAACGAGDTAALPELDARFHMALAEAAHNVVLAHTMHAIFNLIRGSVERAYEAVARRGGTPAELVNQHRTIYDALVARDLEGAERALRMHLTFAGDWGASPPQA